MKNFEKWFLKADRDLKTIKIVLESEDDLYDICCFHAQQAAEKVLKAYLTAHNLSFPKSHQLTLLVKLCSEKNNIYLDILPIAKKIEVYGISPRYPDDIDDLNLSDAEQAYEIALAIKEFVTTHFFD